MYYYRMMDSNDWLGGLMMMFLGLVFIVVVVAITARLLKNNETSVKHTVKPLDIAKERYAKGELTKEDFLQLKKDIEA